MKYLICLLLIFGLTDLNAQSGKSKVQTKIASYEAEKTLDDIKWYDGEPEGIQMINIKVPQEVVNMYPELREKRVGFGMTNRIIEALEEAGRFYFVEEKDEIKQCWLCESQGEHNYNQAEIDKFIYETYYKK